jgi:hypothetical protein
MSDPITALPTPPSTGDPDNFDARADAFLGALPTFQSELNTFASNLNNLSTSSISSTSLALSVVEKTLTVETGKSYYVGMSVKIAYAQDGTKWMIGDVTSYDSGTGELVVEVDTVKGSGTYDDWVITLSFNGQIEPEQAPSLATASSVTALSNRVNFAAVRNTVQTGPIDANGRADFISDNGGLSVITDDLTVTPLILSYGDGFDEKGEVNITVKLESNLTWSGLTDDAVNYLYVDYDDSGNVASATASTLPPDYRQAPETDISSPSSGQFWYPTKHRSRGKTYNGATWDSELRVCVGQATASSGSITDVVSYAYQGKAAQDFTALTAGSGFSFNHNIGVPFDLLIAKRKLRIVDPVSNFVTGEVMDLDFQPIGTGTSSVATGVKLVSVPSTERTAILNNVGNQSTFNQLLETTGNSNNAVSVSKTSLKTLIQRAF